MIVSQTTEVFLWMQKIVRLPGKKYWNPELNQYAAITVVSAKQQ